MSLKNINRNLLEIEHLKKEISKFERLKAIADNPERVNQVILSLNEELTKKTKTFNYWGLRNYW